MADSQSLTGGSPMRSPGWFRCISLLVAWAAPTEAAICQQRFTLQQALSAPFGSELVAAPVGGKVAWMENVLGSRNIWIAGPPDYKGHQITHFSGDNGRYLVQLGFTPDASAIAYVYGGAHSGRGLQRPRNASVEPAGGKQEIWIVSAAGGVPALIDDVNWPAVSPLGNWVAYLKQDQ